MTTPAPSCVDNPAGIGGRSLRDGGAGAGAVSRPCHVAIVMDGNGRWAEQQGLPRLAGHQAGVNAARQIVRACGEKGIEVLTLFAFSSENWHRPAEEVDRLMGLLRTGLEQEASSLHEQNVRLTVVGERRRLDDMLRQRIARVEELTRANSGLQLVIAMDYGGRWDVTRACREIAIRVRDGRLNPDLITPELVDGFLSLSELPPPDLFVRTGGEIRLSNFLIWHLAYTELYFTDTLWPEFDRLAFDAALDEYASRQRRFGRLTEQVVQARAT